ncbi:MAG TPA: lipopolysaccharide heptosyltransferase II [Patescibacteria group bacterium]|nr:lipopolysaccharide heptosyltransferase II [Patescibacteria group bacterium]
MKQVNPKKRILIFNVNWLGDVLFSTATIRNVRYNFPDSYIACVIPSRCYPVLKGSPHLDEIIIFDEKDRHKGLLAKLKFVQLLKSKQFDTAFLLHRSFRRALICRLAGIKEKIGYYTRKRGFILDKNIPPVDPHTMHRIDYYLHIIEKAGLRVEDRYTEFFVGEEDAEATQEFLQKNLIRPADVLVGINPGGNWMPKRWPKDYWAILADKIMSGLGAKVIITGGPADILLAEGIRDAMRRKPVIACGVFTIKQLGALCKRLDLFITADTGPLHIANSVGAKRIIALFGPTDPLVTGPYPVANVAVIRKDVGCKIPCYQVHCKDRHCMKAITPEEVYQAAKDILSPKR